MKPKNPLLEIIEQDTKRWPRYDDLNAAKGIFWFCVANLVFWAVIIGLIMWVW